MPPKVEIVVQDFVGFIAEYAPNISKGGMFIGTEEPHPSGTEVEFDVHLAEDRFSLIHGRGVVVWVRAGGARAPGMGIRFTSLEGDSLSLIERIVDNYVAEGGTPFELEREAPIGSSEPLAPGSVAEQLSSDAPAAARAPHVDDEPQAQPSDEGEPLSAVRSLGHSGRAFAPGMEPVEELESQEERARAPKPAIPGVDSESPYTSPPSTEPRSAPPASEPAAPQRPAIEVPTFDEPLVAWEEDPPVAPTSEPPPAEDEATLSASPAKTASDDELSVEEPALDLEGEIELSLDSDDDDFSIEFDTTNSLESERETTAADDGGEETEDAAGAVAEQVADHDAPDLSASLGHGMERADTGFQEALRSGDADAPDDTDAGDDDPFYDSAHSGDFGLPVADEDAASPLDEPGDGLDLGDLGDIGDTSSLEALVGELRTEVEESDEAAAEPAGGVADSPVSDLDLEALAALDAELDAGYAAEEARGEPPEPAEERPAARTPSVERPALRELEAAPAYQLPPVRGRRWRGGQLRRWTILLLLLGAVGGGVFVVREQGVDLLLGPGSAFELSAEPLAESEDLSEIEPSTLLELMQQEQSQVEIEELDGGRQRQARPLSLIENVTWQETDRTTILTLWGNGDFTPSSTTYVRLDGETSREVLQIRGVDEPYWFTGLRIGTEAVEGLRFGYGERKPFNEVHVAIDLTRSSARVRRIELDGRRLRVFVR
jgi:uncharacterized protein (TIGR02266 family)